MDTKKLLAILSKRESGLKARIARERRSLRRLDRKSHRLRVTTRITPRIGFFTDRLLELQGVISLLNGAMTPQEFVILSNGDDLDFLVSGLGKVIER